MFKKLSKTANPKVCLRCRVMTSSKWQNPNHPACLCRERR